MSKKSRISPYHLWLAIGVGVLIILLLLWLTFAMLGGDTDVAACIPLVFM